MSCIISSERKYLELYPCRLNHVLRLRKGRKSLIIELLKSIACGVCVGDCPVNDISEVEESYVIDPAKGGNKNGARNY